MKKEILLVDGMALLFRGYYATAFRGNFMKTKNGMPTNGVYQFSRYLFDAIEKFDPTHVICCWDMGSKTFRTELYNDYKANRSAPPEELIPQFDLVKKVTDTFNIPNIGLENYEADDCIGTLARDFSNEDNVLVLTGDHDILQLVDDNVRVAIMKKGIGNYDVFDSQNFFDKKGIQPNQIVDLKGLMGDSADNYPGVKGIGEKTALKLLQEYKTIDQLLAHMEHLPKGIQTKLTKDMEMLMLSRQLAKINCEAPIACDLEEAVWHYEPDVIEDKLTESELNHMTPLLSIISS